MDIAPAAAAASANTAAQTQVQVSVNVFKKAIDIGTEGALALINAIPTPPAVGTSGGQINTWA